jgi:hypothetical protein
MMALTRARVNVAAARTRLAVSNAAAMSRDVPDAQLILDRAEGVLTNLDLQIAAYGANENLGQARAALTTLTERVRGDYLEAVAVVLTDRAVPAFERAERVAAQLPRAVSEVDLAQIEARPPTALLLEPSRIALADWVGRVRTQMDAFDADAKSIADARPRGDTNLPERIARFERQRDLIELSLKAIGHWDQAL